MTCTSTQRPLIVCTERINQGRQARLKSFCKIESKVIKRRLQRIMEKVGKYRNKLNQHCAEYYFSL